MKPPSQLHLLLTDDDEDDCLFFKEVLETLNIPVQLTIIEGGPQLMKWLTEKTNSLPDLLFLDLNMPRKNGYECLAEIKQDQKLKHIPVIIYSTALNLVDVDSLYKTGAHYYIQKPGDFGDLSRAIGHVLNLPEEKRRIQPKRSDFLLFHTKRPVIFSTQG